MKNADRILIIDDNPEDIRLIGNILKKEKYLISIAQSGEQAFKILENELPDCILLDINMPVMGGYEICRKLKSMKNTRDIPIIFVTGQTDSQSIINGFECGCYDYVTKPFIVKELLVRLKRAIELNNYYSNLKKLVDKRTEQLTKEIKKQKETEQKLIDAKKETEMKNNALCEVLAHIDAEKRKYNEQLINNIRSVILPALDKIRTSVNIENSNCALVFEQLNKYICDITGIPDNLLKNILSNLTAKEYSVCELIKQGKSNKEISETLNISEDAVKFHRKNIRKKLNIANSDINLYYFLNNL